MSKPTLFDNNPIGYITYKRTYARDNGKVKEEYEDTISRCLTSAQEDLNCNFTEEELSRLRHYLYTAKGLFAGRFFWQLGTKTVQKHGLLSLQNCAGVVINEAIRPFTWTMDMLMLGAGVGANIQREYVYEIPKVKNKVKIERVDSNDCDFIIPDNREGWVEFLRRVLEASFVTGKGFTFSTNAIRPKGAKIEGFGGIAAGPEDLVWGMMEINNILNSRAKKKIRTSDAADIICILGYIVVSGNIRRAAIILLGDFDDLDFLKLKRWDLGTIPKYRAMSNNTVVCDDISKLPDLFWEGYLGKGEPYGLCNLKNCREYAQIPIKKQNLNVVSINPCQPSFATVLTPTGISTIGKLGIGDFIWSGKKWTRVVNKFYTGVKPVYEYKTSTGRFIGTENHKVVENGIKIEVKDASSIDYNIGESIEDFYLLNLQDVMDGLVIGDGGIHKASNNLVGLFIGKNDCDYFNNSISEYIIKHRPGISSDFYEVNTTISVEELPKTFERTVPDRFYYGNKKTKLGFLRGLFSANGSVNGDRVCLKQTSYELIKQVQEMLSSLGIRSYITINKPKTVTFKNGDYECKQSYDLNITSNRTEFKKLIGFIQKYKQDAIKESGNIKYTTSNIYESEYLGDMDVFDITVDCEEHTYWTGGCLVSNCGEQPLENYETCCLGEIILSKCNTFEEAKDVLTSIYRVCKHSLTLSSSIEETTKIVHKNFRIGISADGFLQYTDEHKSWMKPLTQYLKEYDKEYSAKIGVPESVSLFTIKPSGTLSLLADVSPGCHPSYSPFYIRRIRFASNSQLLEKCRDAKLEVEPQINFDGTHDTSTYVVSFPYKAPKNSKFAKEVTAIDQLETMVWLQENWSDNAVSCTVYYKLEELDSIKEWLRINYNDKLKGCSFLLHSNHGFKQAPLEEITESVYEEMNSKIDWSKLNNINSGIEGFDESDCGGGACPVR